MDRFSIDPEYFVDDEDSERYSGNAEIISKYFGAAKESVERYLIKWTDEHYDNGNIFAYDNDECAYTDCWQMVDFMDKIGFTYGWENEG